MPVKITPEIVNNGLVLISKLKQGDCFIAEDSLWMLIESDPFGINLGTGEEQEFSYEALVIPVDVEIIWKKKTTKKDKK